MVIGFCGNFNEYSGYNLFDNIEKFLSKKIAKEIYITFLIVEENKFDDLCYNILFNLKRSHPQIEIVFVTDEAQKNIFSSDKVKKYYDSKILLYFENVNKDGKFKKDKWIIDNSDLMVFSVNEKDTEKEKAFSYAIEKGKEYLNF